MAKHRESRKKTRNAAGVKRHADRRQSRAKAKKKAEKPVKAKNVKRVPKKQARPYATVGAPPADMTPPQFNETESESVPVSPRQMDLKVDVAPAPAAAVPSLAPPAKPVGPPIPGKPTGALVVGARCTFMGRTSECAEDMATQALLCPHCHGRVLNGPPDEDTQLLGFEAWELGAYPAADHTHPARPHPGYRGLIAWMRSQGTCFNTIEQAAMMYKQATGMSVDPGL